MTANYLKPIDRESVYLWADPNEPGIYYDQPNDDLRRAKRYTEFDRKMLEHSIGEPVEIIEIEIEPKLTPDQTQDRLRETFLRLRENA